jgi:transposase
MRRPAITADELPRITIGVDTHLDVHVAAALDQLGRLLATTSVPATSPGYRALLGWARRLGTIDQAAIEGTGSYGAGLTRYLRDHGVAVVEVDRPNRRLRRRRGKSDPIDAEAAARAALAGEATGQPKHRDGHVEMIRALRVARTSAVKARTQAANQLRSLLVSAPAELRQRLGGRRLDDLVRLAASLRPGTLDSPTAATKFALKQLAGRYQALTAELERLDLQLGKLTSKAAPTLVRRPGVGTEVASALLVAAGDNPQRLRTEAAFARLCGVTPQEASSGRTVRHRLNRGGNRQANNALWRIVLVRMKCDPRTKAYVTRRLAEGLSKPEVMRCLKRYVAREVFHHLRDHPGPGSPPPRYHNLIPRQDSGA